MPDNLTVTTVKDPSQRDALHAMLSEFLITVSDQYFTDRAFAIDGYRFINCSFSGCRLTTRRGTFELHHCLFLNTTRVITEDAQKAVQFYTAFNPQLIAAGNALWGPKINEDGTISIGRGTSFQ
jgi:hypothetical protein